MSVQTITNILDWIDIHIQDSPSLRQVADEFGYSSYYCSAQFHKHLGISFQSYVSSRKIQSAALELAKTDSRILDVALQYGFSSHASFTRLFTKTIGCTPSEYRKETPNVKSTRQK